MDIFKDFFRVGGPLPPALENLATMNKGSLVSVRPRALEIYGPALRPRQASMRRVGPHCRGDREDKRLCFHTPDLVGPF
jgi:hypothetical protein